MLFRGPLAMPMTAGPMIGWPIGAAHRIQAGEDAEAVRAEMLAAWEALRDTAAGDDARAHAEAEIARIQALPAPRCEG